MLVETSRAGAPFPHCCAAHGVGRGPPRRPRGVLRWGWVEVILRVSLEVILRKLLRHLDSHPPGRGLSEGVVRGGRQGPCQELYDLSLVVW